MMFLLLCFSGLLEYKTKGQEGECMGMGWGRDNCGDVCKQGDRSQTFKSRCRQTNVTDSTGRKMRARGKGSVLGKGVKETEGKRKSRKRDGALGKRLHF